MSTAIDVPSSGNESTPLPFGAAVLDDAQGRRAAELGQALHELAHGARHRRRAADALILREAARSVHAIPMQDRVERIEEWLGTP